MLSLDSIHAVRSSLKRVVGQVRIRIRVNFRVSVDRGDLPCTGGLAARAATHKKKVQKTKTEGTGHADAARTRSLACHHGA
jgi:hypothetical protein